MNFDIFWGFYPRKIKKKDAKKMWDRLTQENKQKALDAIVKHKEHWEDIGTEIQYIPHAASWLNGERWDDEFEEVNLAKVNFLRSVK